MALASPASSFYRSDCVSSWWRVRYIHFHWLCDAMDHIKLITMLGVRLSQFGLIKSVGSLNNFGAVSSHLSVLLSSQLMASKTSVRSLHVPRPVSSTFSVCSSEVSFKLRHPHSSISLDFNFRKLFITFYQQIVTLIKIQDV